MIPTSRLRLWMIWMTLVTATGCGAAKRPIAVSLERPDAIVYQGTLSSAANKRAFELYAKVKTKPRLLRISSDGGDVNLGMDLGDFVFRNQLDVEVIDYCLSSCANYVFPAGKVKFLNPSSTLMWHGGAFQPGLEEQLKDAGRKGQAYLEGWRKRERAFFARIGVNQAITTYGQTASHVVRPEGTVGYDYSIEDMAKFGITNVVEKEGPWQWRERSHSQIARVKVILTNGFTDENAGQHAAGAGR